MFVIFQRLHIENNCQNKLFFSSITSNPLSSLVLSSTEPTMTFQRESMSVKYPRNIGQLADRANYIIRHMTVCHVIYHYRAHDGKLIIKMARLINITALERDLTMNSQTHSHIRRPKPIPLTCKQQLPIPNPMQSM